MLFTRNAEEKDTFRAARDRLCLGAWYCWLRNPCNGSADFSFWEVGPLRPCRPSWGMWANFTAYARSRWRSSAGLVAMASLILAIVTLKCCLHLGSDIWIDFYEIAMQAVATLLFSGHSHHALKIQGCMILPTHVQCTRRLSAAGCKNWWMVCTALISNLQILYRNQFSL